MANFECKVVKIDEKENHPNADRLTLYKIGGYTCISNKLEDGSDRYNVGDLVVYIPENAVLPEWLLKRMNFWNKEKNCGMLAGKEGNRVKPLKLRGIFSEGVLYPAMTETEYDEGCHGCAKQWGYSDDQKFIVSEKTSYISWLPAVEGENVADFLGITKYEQPIPASMGGEIFNGGTEIVVPYDVEPIQKYMDAFIDGEIFEATEKVHGCADYDTIIDSLKYGKIKIGEYVEKDIINDMVKSYNVDTKEIEYRPVLGVSVQENIDNWYLIEMDDGTSIKLTGNHLVWCENLNGYRAVEDLDGTEKILIDNN